MKWFDARISELFQSEQLQINLTKSVRWSCEEPEEYYTVSVNMNGKEVYKTEEQFD